MVRVPEELESLCVEHSREQREYAPEEDFDEGEEYEKKQDRVFANKAYALAQVRTDLVKARAKVDHLQDFEEGLTGGSSCT